MEKTKVIKNESNQDIINYPISEAEIDKQTGNPIIDPGTGIYKSTGITYTWSIRAKEVLEFPAYVADYLMSVYAFLTKVDDKVIEESSEESKEEVLEEVSEEEPKKVLKEGECRFCGRVFETNRGLAMHMAAAHTEEVVK